MTLDLGQGRELEAVRDRALAAGAVRAHVLDVREEFARDFVLPALKADAAVDDRLSAGRARSAGRSSRRSWSRSPRIEQARRRRPRRRRRQRGALDVPVRALDPTLTVIAPAATGA